MIQDFPIITISQVVMLRNDLYTGHIVDINMEWSIEKMQEIWTVYDSIENAIRDAKIIVKENERIECCIFDKDRKLLQLIQPE